MAPSDVARRQVPVHMMVTVVMVVTMTMTMMAKTDFSGSSPRASFPKQAGA